MTEADDTPSPMDAIDFGTIELDTSPISVRISSVRGRLDDAGDDGDGLLLVPRVKRPPGSISGSMTPRTPRGDYPPRTPRGDYPPRTPRGDPRTPIRASLSPESSEDGLPSPTGSPAGGTLTRTLKRQSPSDAPPSIAAIFLPPSSTPAVALSLSASPPPSAAATSAPAAVSATPRSKSDLGPAPVELSAAAPPRSASSLSGPDASRARSTSHSKSDADDERRHLSKNRSASTSSGSTAAAGPLSRTDGPTQSAHLAVPASSSSADPPLPVPSLKLHQLGHSQSEPSRSALGSEGPSSVPSSPASPLKSGSLSPERSPRLPELPAEPPFAVSPPVASAVPARLAGGRGLSRSDATRSLQPGGVAASLAALFSAGLRDEVASNAKQMTQESLRLQQAAREAEEAAARYNVALCSCRPPMSFPR
eukprot:TRINITY_DN10086_c0_g1_i1.p1 TRINITY_DN10086_c0_g1~~TRINITY_DN10086_c0_g1_i1.p1  ORF type:complete len:422 (-),score=98.50 TRINITY_DN10086_c0_g1_i1:64-1329(-)